MLKGELSFEPSLLVAEALYWDEVEEQDDGIPRRYGTIKASKRCSARPAIEVLRGEVRKLEFEPE